MLDPFGGGSIEIVPSISFGAGMEGTFPQAKKKKNYKHDEIERRVGNIRPIGGSPVVGLPLS